jgi:D-amino-acid dehydrogenase
MSHVVVLGAGVIGLSCALACQRRGHQVTIIDRQPARRDGCSFGNAGMVVPSHFVPLAAPGMVALGFKWMWNPESPFFIKPRIDKDLLAWGWRFIKSATPEHVARCAPLIRDLSLASRQQFIEWQESGEDIGLTTKGLIMLCRTEHGMAEEVAAASKAAALGIPAEVLDAPGLAHLDPNITMDVKGGVYYPKDAHLSPEKFVHSLERHLRDGGATFVWDAAITGWKRESGKITAAVTRQGDVAAEHFVLATGAWSDGMMSGLGLRLPMQSGKGYSVTVPEPVELPEKCAILTEARVAVTPMGRSLRFGGTMEIAGCDESITRRRVQGIIKAACLYYPEFRAGHFEGIEPWRGLRPCSPDGMPYLGRTKAASNLVLATGHAMMGLSLAPVTGRLCGQLVDNEPTDFDLRMLDPDRFA